MPPDSIWKKIPFIRLLSDVPKYFFSKLGILILSRWLNGWLIWLNGDHCLVWTSRQDSNLYLTPWMGQYTLDGIRVRHLEKIFEKGNLKPWYWLYHYVTSILYAVFFLTFVEWKNVDIVKHCLKNIFIIYIYCCMFKLQSHSPHWEKLRY